MTKWALLAAAILSETAASLSLKAALELPALYVVVVTGYVTSFGLLAMILRRGMPLGVAYGIWGALGVALTAGMSALLFDEPISTVTGLGILLVIAGVLTVELGAGSSTQVPNAGREDG